MWRQRDFLGLLKNWGFNRSLEIFSRNMSGINVVFKKKRLTLRFQNKWMVILILSIGGR